MDKEKLLDIRELRRLTGLSRIGFAKKYEIPLRTVENWEYKVTSCPSYVAELLQRKVLEDVEAQAQEKARQVVEQEDSLPALVREEMRGKIREYCMKRILDEKPLMLLEFQLLLTLGLFEEYQSWKAQVARTEGE